MSNSPGGVGRTASTGMDGAWIRVPTGRSNEAQFTPSLHEDIHWVPAFIGMLGRILDQQANRHPNGSTPALWAISSLND